MRTIKIYVLFFICLSCICGMCSKDDAGSSDNNNNDTHVEPDLKPDATWVYFDDAPSLVYSYSGNKRDKSEKWMATKIDPAFSGVTTSDGKRYLTWAFENTGDTRFLSNTLNPGGKERVSVFIGEITTTPGVGSYTDLNCWYDVYNSAGTKYDSTKTAALDCTFNITRLNFFQSIGATVDRYKMSGAATFNVLYWPPGAPSADLYTLQCHFNNVFIDFLK